MKIKTFIQSHIFGNLVTHFNLTYKPRNQNEIWRYFEGNYFEKVNVAITKIMVRNKFCLSISLYLASLGMYHWYS